jgi:ubiquinone/menaquinone biosynthesis C-methylase UbiE
MKDTVDLYDSHYSQVEADVYRAIRTEAFGEDLGQTSWITAKECDEFCRWLGLEAGHKVLEIACGTGGVSLRMASRFGVSVTGIDINPSAVAAASDRALLHGLQDQAEFRVADATGALPFADESFDIVFCNDAINHLPDRRGVLSECHRVLRPGGRCLYTDPIVVTGCLSNAEIDVRSSIGFFLFTPPGANETFLRETGFRVALTADVTENVAQTSARWHDGRASRRAQLSQLESEREFDELQAFLSVVCRLSSERRLSRIAYMGEKRQ